MSVRDDIDRRVAEWLVEDAPGRAPDHLRDAIDRRLDRTPKRAIFPALPLTSRSLRFWVPAAALTLILIAVLTVGLLAAGSQPQPAHPMRMVGVLQPAGSALFGDVATTRSGLVAVGTVGVGLVVAAGAVAWHFARRVI